MNPGNASKLDKKKKREIYEEYLQTYDLENIISEMTNSVVHSQDPNPIVYMIKYLTGLLTEEERTEFSINIDPPYPQGVPIVKFPKYKIENCLSKYLTKNNWYNYKYRKTSYNNDINNLTYLSDHSDEDKIGIVLVDKDCLNTYNDLLENIIYDVHKIDINKKNNSYKIGNSPPLFKEKLFFYDELKTCLKTIKFVFYRNIEGYTYNNLDKRNGKLKCSIEEEMLDMKKEGILPDDLEPIETSKMENFINNDETIIQEYKWMNKAGFVNRNYTLNDRSIWVSKKKSITILINFSNHFELLLSCDAQNLDLVIENYNYVMEIIKQARVRFTFDTDQKFGYITSNLAFIGGGFQIIGLFEHKNIKKREDILKSKNLFCYTFKNDSQIIFYFKFCFYENNYISCIDRSLSELFGIKKVCDDLNIKVNKDKIKFNNMNSPISKAYEASFTKCFNQFNYMGKNINEIIKYYKQTENDSDLLFTSKYSYLIFQDLIDKYLYYRDNINLEISNFLNKLENPKDITNIESSDFIDSLVNINICLRRNIADFPFPYCSNSKQYNSKTLEIIKNALNDLNKKHLIGTFMSLSEAETIIKEHDIQIFHNDKMKNFGYDLDFPENRGFIKFEKPNLFATINDLNNMNFIFAVKNVDDKIDLKATMEHMILLVNKFSSKIKFAFSQKYGFFTTCPKYIGNGISMSVDMKIHTLKNEFFDEYIKDKNMVYKEISKQNETDDFRVIRFTNKGSFNESEIEMFCNWIFYINELTFKD